jgi:hypothetical protein
MTGKGTPATTAARRAGIDVTGLELELAPGDLVSLTGAVVAPIGSRDA